jgi:putative transposase
MERDVLKRSVAPLGQGSDATVSLAALIATRRANYGILHTVSCRALGVAQA